MQKDPLARKIGSVLRNPLLFGTWSDSNLFAPGALSGEIGAGDRPRTGYLNLGKVALYQVSYARSTE